MLHHEADEKALAPNLLLRIVGNVAIFRVNINNVGEYGLQIYANNPMLHQQLNIIECHTISERETTQIHILMYRR